jgi:hypothetical protein
MFFILQHLTASQPLMNCFRQQRKGIVEAVLNCMCLAIETEIVKGKDRSSVIINKCWNVVRIIGENPVLIPGVKQTLEDIISRLVFYLESNRHLDFEEDCFILMAAFIRHSSAISQFVLSLFELIPPIVYGQYQGKFGHSFQALQMVLYHGSSSFFTDNPQVTRKILEMSLYSLQRQASANPA